MRRLRDRAGAGSSRSETRSKILPADFAIDDHAITCTDHEKNDPWRMQSENGHGCYRAEGKGDRGGAQVR